MSFSVDLWNGFDIIKARYYFVNRKANQFSSLLSKIVEVEKKIVKELENLYKEVSESFTQETDLDEAYYLIIEDIKVEVGRRKQKIDYINQNVIKFLNEELPKPSTMISLHFDENKNNLYHINNAINNLIIKQSDFHSSCKDLCMTLAQIEVSKINENGKINQKYLNYKEKCIKKLYSNKEEYINYIIEANIKREKYNQKTEDLLDFLEKKYKQLVGIFKEGMVRFYKKKIGILKSECKICNNIFDTKINNLDPDSEVLTFIKNNATKEFPMNKLELIPYKTKDSHNKITNKFKDSVSKSDLNKIFNTINNFFIDNKICRTDYVYTGISKLELKKLESDFFFQKKIHFFKEKKDKKDKDKEKKDKDKDKEIDKDKYKEKEKEKDYDNNNNISNNIFNMINILNNNKKKDKDKEFDLFEQEEEIKRNISFIESFINELIKRTKSNEILLKEKEEINLHYSYTNSTNNNNNNNLILNNNNIIDLKKNNNEMVDNYNIKEEEMEKSYWDEMYNYYKSLDYLLSEKDPNHLVYLESLIRALNNNRSRGNFLISSTSYSYLTNIFINILHNFPNQSFLLKSVILLSQTFYRINPNDGEKIYIQKGIKNHYVFNKPETWHRAINYNLCSGLLNKDVSVQVSKETQLKKLGEIAAQSIISYLADMKMLTDNESVFNEVKNYYIDIYHLDNNLVVEQVNAIYENMSGNSNDNYKKDKNKEKEKESGNISEIKENKNEKKDFDNVNVINNVSVNFNDTIKNDDEIKDGVINKIKNENINDNNINDNNNYKNEEQKINEIEVNNEENIEDNKVEKTEYKKNENENINDDENKNEFSILNKEVIEERNNNEEINNNNNINNDNNNIEKIEKSKTYQPGIKSSKSELIYERKKAIIVEPDLPHSLLKQDSFFTSYEIKKDFEKNNNDNTNEEK